MKEAAAVLPQSQRVTLNLRLEPMGNSEAAKAFACSIEDAERLLARFGSVPQSEQAEAEVLKRAGLVMAMASWETYIKSRVVEEFDTFSQATDGSLIGKLARRRLEEDLKRFFNPNSERTGRLTREHFDVDITEGWKWDNYTPQQAKAALDLLIKKRGSAAHEANISTHPSAAPDVVKRDELAKAIRFLRGLVAATEKVQLAR